LRRKSYTILILPHATSRFHKVTVSAAFLGTLGVVAAAILVAALLLPHTMLQSSNQAGSLEELARGNRELRAEKEKFEGELAQMSSQLDKFEARAGRLAQELGVTELPSAPAAGGPAPAGKNTRFGQELNVLSSRAETLDNSLDELDHVFRERIRLLSSTPNTMPVEGWFSHGFGWRNDPWSGKREFHKGIDIVADAGTEITAPADGVVTRAGRNGGYGKAIDLSHGYGYVTRYAHLSEILVRAGQRVRRGQMLGRVGSTGRSTGSHLHYEVFRDGRRVNPWKYIGQKGS